MNRLGNDVVPENKIVKFVPEPHKSIFEIDEMYELVSEPQWSKENPLIIKGGNIAEVIERVRREHKESR